MIRLKCASSKGVPELGEDNGRILARAWAHRMQWFFNKEFGSDAAGPMEFTPEMIAEYPEPTELTRLFEDNPDHEQIQERVGSIRRIPLP